LSHDDQTDHHNQLHDDVELDHEHDDHVDEGGQRRRAR
jgi:hypothetical protein